MTPDDDGGRDGMTTLDETIKVTVTEHLMAAKGNQRSAAKTLGISRWALARMVKKYSIRIVRGEGPIAA